MSTPTSPARPPDAGPGAPRPPIAATLAALAHGTVGEAEVVRLSDLDRGDAAALAAAWSALPEATRVAVVRRIDELAEARIDLEFGRALRVALDDASPVVRQLAVAGLWEDERGDLLGRLRAVLAADPSEDVRAEAAKGLGRFAEQAAAHELDDVTTAGLRRDLLNLADDEVAPLALRRRALESVGAFGRDPAVRAVVRTALDAGDDGLRASALFAIGRGLDPSWLPTLIEELGSPEPELRYEAARALGALGADDAVPDLSGLVDDHDAEVRHAAIAALGQIGGRGPIRVLRELAERADESDEEAIEEALEEAVSGAEPLRVER